MLRNIIKLTRRTGGFLPFKSQSFQPITLTCHPFYRFASDEPPKGFEKFRRREEKKKEQKAKEADTPSEQKIESEEVEEKPKNENKKIRWEMPSEKSEEEQLKERQKMRERDVEREKKMDVEKDKRVQERQKEREEEEEMENDDKNEKKQKTDSPFNFGNFKWGDKFGGGKDGNKGGFDPKNIKIKPMGYLALAVLAVMVGEAVYESYNDQNQITYIDFMKNYLEQEKVNKIHIRTINDGTNQKTIAVVETTHEGLKTLVLGNVDNFLENLEKSQLERGKSPERFIPIEFEYKADANKILDRVISFFYLAMTIAIFYSIYRQIKTGMGGMNKGGNDIFGIGKSQVKIYGMDNKIKTRFKDVAGLDEAKVEITEFVDFLKKPKRFKDIGAKIPRGALMTGPPGTGKTLLAKAAAGEAGVPFLYISGSDFVEMFVGVGASRVRDLFKKAKENAPSIIFIDEIDAVGRKRESKMGGNDERDNTLNQLLVEMDGFGTENNVVVLAATNRKELLDPALTRPGRFDRSIEITLPDIEGRKQIFMVHLKPLKLDPGKTLDEYAKRLATLTPGFSGADIANLCNEAAILAARKNKKTVSTEEFESASERVLAGLEKKRIVSEEERRVIAIHESGHAVVSWFLEGGSPLLKLTIIPRSKGSLGFAQYLPNESSLETKEELMDRIASVLGGRCSEELFVGRITTGAYDDLRKAYDIAHNMITKFGMSDRIGFIGFHDEDYFRKHSNDTAREIDDEIKKIIDECTVRARDMVRKHKKQIEELSDALLKKETLDLQAIVGILGERPFPPKSNFKAYLEVRQAQDEEGGKQEKEKHDDDNADEKKDTTGDKQPSQSV